MTGRIDRRRAILLLKLTPGVRNEAGALALGRGRIRTVGRRVPRRLRRRDVLVIRSARLPDTLRLDRRRTTDLRTEAGRQQLTDALGLTGGRALAVREAISQTGAGARDELAQLARVLAWVEAGKVPDVDRLVLSGHVAGDGIRGNFPGERAANGELSFTNLEQLARAFPEAAGRVRHLMLSACYLGGDEDLFHRLRRIFPNLTSVTAYADKAPAGRSRASYIELSRWARSTDRGEPPRRKGVFGDCRTPAPTESNRTAYRRHHGVVITGEEVSRCR